MKIVYIAHPIRGDVASNCARIEQILRTIFRQIPGYYPIAPYLHACEMLDDAKEENRDRGLEFDRRCIKSGLVDELWVCHDRISDGVMKEIAWAREQGISVRFMAREFSKIGVREIPWALSSALHGAKLKEMGL